MFVVKKRSLVIVAVLVATVITFVVCFSALSKTAVGEASVSGIKIVLDAGHGGVDGGVSGVNSKVKESELNLMITKKIGEYISDAGMSVVLTRSSDAGLYGVATSSLKKRDMEKRKSIIHSAKPNLVVSIHLNQYSVSTRRGAQVFFKQGDEKGKMLAQSIQAEFNSLEESTRAFTPLKGDYYILNCSSYPSVIAECGFLSNPEEEALLLTEEYRDKIAYSVFKGIVSFLAQTTSVFER